MKKLQLSELSERGQELRSYDVVELMKNEVCPKLIIIADHDTPLTVELGDAITKELIQCCEPQELPYAIGQVRDGVVIPFEFGKRCKQK